MKAYKAIEAWGRMMGSFQYYIEGQVTKARADNAPEFAIYKHDDGTWHTLADVTNPETIRYFETNYPELWAAAKAAPTGQAYDPSAEALAKAGMDDGDDHTGSFRSFILGFLCIATMCQAACSTAPQTASAGGVDARAVYDGTDLAAMNADAAKALGVAVLPLPQVFEAETDLGGDYHFAKTMKAPSGRVIIAYHPGKLKNFHMFHELIHYYQFSYGLNVGHANCKAPIEVHAMLATEQWNAGNGGPTHDAQWAYRLGGCK